MTAFARVGTGLLVALGLFCPPAARADGWTISTPLESTVNPATGAASISRFYLTPEAGWQFQNLPSFHLGVVSLSNSAPYYSSRLGVSGGQGGLTLGYWLPASVLGGQHPRIELSGNIFSLSGDTSQSYAPPLPGHWSFVGGGAQPDTGEVFSSRLHGRLSGGELALRGAVDFPMGANLVVTPSAAVYGGWSRLGLDYSETAACLDGACFIDTQTNRVRTREFGGTLSIGSRFAVARTISLLFGGGAGLVYSHSELSASDCFDDTDSVAGCQGTFGGPSPSATSATASHSGLGYRLMAQTGARVTLGPAEVNLLGGVRYGPVAAINNPSHANQTVSVSSSQQLGYSLMLQVRLPFGSTGP